MFLAPHSKLARAACFSVASNTQVLALSNPSLSLWFLTTLNEREEVGGALFYNNSPGLYTGPWEAHIITDAALLAQSVDFPEESVT